MNRTHVQKYNENGPSYRFEMAADIKLNNVDERLALQEEANDKLIHNVDMKNKEVSKLFTIRKALKNKLKLQSKEYTEYVIQTYREIDESLKTIKGKFLREK